MEAYYDPSTDKIVGAVPGTWSYYHEEVHRRQYHRWEGLDLILTKVHIRGYYAAIFSSILLTIVVGPVGIIYGVGMGMLPHVMIIALMEAEAYTMGTINYLRRRT